MTGRYSLRTGVYNTRFGGDTMHSDEITIAEVLQKRGYRTGLIGKWHLGRYARYLPWNRGFDTALAFPQGHAERYFHSNQFRFNGKPVETRGHITDVITDSAAAFIRANRTRPFFLYVAYNAPHAPHWEEDRYVEKYLKMGLSYTDARIYGMVEHCDDGIGRLLQTLEAEGLTERTVVAFLCDNGGVSRHWRGGLRGAKASAYEGGVRSPLFVRWPGRFRAGAINDDLTAHFDIFPTFCELAGASVPKDRKMDGASLLPVLQGGERIRPRTYICHTWDRHYPSTDGIWGVSGERFKAAYGRLYDLSADPGEQHDISSANGATAKEMRSQFLRWFEDVTSGKTYEPVAIEVGRPDDNPVEIQASWARLGDASPEYIFEGYDWDCLEKWRVPGTSARWKLEVVRSGRYEVEFSYGADPAHGGEFEISAGASKLRVAVQPDGGSRILQRHAGGTIQLNKGPATLQVTATRLAGPDLMALNRIWLRLIDS
jgi:arylsulfatase A